MKRVAQCIARAGVCSRREAEKLVQEGRVQLNGQILRTPQATVSSKDYLMVDGESIPTVAGKTRVFKFHKPKGLMTTTNDPNNRDTVFSHIAHLAQLPRVISIGRLDYNSEGLLLLTNDGELARALELPESGLDREYHVRVRTRRPLTNDQLNQIKEGMKIGATSFAPLRLHVEKQGSSNFWVKMVLSEGKNREIRRIFESLGGQVSRLVRVKYGPVELGNLPKGDVEELPYPMIRELQARVKKIYEAEEKEEKEREKSGGKAKGERAAFKAKTDDNDLTKQHRSSTSNIQ